MYTDTKHDTTVANNELTLDFSLSILPLIVGMLLLLLSRTGRLGLFLIRWSRRESKGRDWTLTSVDLWLRMVFFPRMLLGRRPNKRLVSA